MESTRKKRVVWTFVIGLFTILTYVGMRFQISGEIIPDSILVKYGAPYAKDIYDGAVYGVITNTFLHRELTPFLLNILAFLIMGWIIERRNGMIFLLFFGLSTSLITSCIEMAISADPGIGLMGVNFAMLSYILLSPEMRWKNPWIRASPWFVVGIILFLCVEQIVKNDYQTAVFAILSGLLYGAIIALTKRIKWLFYPTQFIIISLAAVSVFYNPYSTEWNTVKGYRAQMSGDKKLAQHYYSDALKISPGNLAAKKNMKLLRLDRLMEIAYDFHSKKEYQTARKYYIQILKLDENNKWAKGNLRELP